MEYATFKIERIFVPYLYEEFKYLSPETIDEQYTEVYDRWTWDTGTKEDRELLERLDVERHYRKEAKRGRKLRGGWTFDSQKGLVSSYGIDVEEEIAKVIATNIAKEIDQEILRTLLIDR
jgi:hypothetical protein